MGNAAAVADCVDGTPGDESATPESTSVERATYQEIVTPDTRSQPIDRSTMTDERMVDLVTTGAHLRGPMDLEDSASRADLSASNSNQPQERSIFSTPLYDLQSRQSIGLIDSSREGDESVLYKTALFQTPSDSRLRSGSDRSVQWDLQGLDDRGRGSVLYKTASCQTPSNKQLSRADAEGSGLYGTAFSSQSKPRRDVSSGGYYTPCGGSDSEDFEDSQPWATQSSNEERRVAESTRDRGRGLYRTTRQRSPNFERSSASLKSSSGRRPYSHERPDPSQESRSSSHHAELLYY